MRLKSHAFTLFALAAVATACAKDGPRGADSAATTTAGTAAASAQGGDQDLADVTAYELSMEKVDKLFAAQRNVALRVKDMSPEEREAMKARADADDGNDDSLDDTVRKIESEPVLVGAIREAGLTPREYALLTVSMMQSGMAAGVIKMRPNENQDSLAREMKANPANIRFIQQNEAALEKKQKEMEAEMKRLGIPTDG
jgi:hypothetical protein